MPVDYEYLALEDGPPIFRQDFTCPALLVARLVPQVISRTGLSPAMTSLSKLFRYVLCYHLQAPPISLTTTFGISVDVFSSSY